MSRQPVPFGLAPVAPTSSAMPVLTPGSASNGMHAAEQWVLPWSGVMTKKAVFLCPKEGRAPLGPQQNKLRQCLVLACALDEPTRLDVQSDNDLDARKPLDEVRTSDDRGHEGDGGEPAHSARETNHISAWCDGVGGLESQLSFVPMSF